MTHQHSEADDSIAKALSDSVRQQVAVKPRNVEDLDYGLLAECAMDAIIDYEDEVAREYIQDYPECLEDVDIRAAIARRIRAIDCPYPGIEGITFRAARELAAQVAETYE